MQCYNCKQFGHTTKNCPKGIICHKCKQPGHLGRDCPLLSHKNKNDNEINQNENPQNDLKCYNCGKSGHKSNECPNKKGKFCYLCGKQGHFKAHCPNKNKAKQEDKKEKDKKEDDGINLDENNVVNCPICFQSSNDGIKFKVGKCGHIICKNCCESLFKSKTNIQCPMCKKQVDKNDFMDIFV